MDAVVEQVARDQRPGGRHLDQQHLRRIGAGRPARPALRRFRGLGRQQPFLLEDEAGARAEVRCACRVLTTSGLAIRHWTMAGAGIARMPGFAVRDELRDGRLVRLLPRHVAGRPVLSLLYMPDRLRPANVRRLIEFSLRRFGGMRPAVHP